MSSTSLPRSIDVPSVTAIHAAPAGDKPPSIPAASRRNSGLRAASSRNIAVASLSSLGTSVPRRALHASTKASRSLAAILDGVPRLVRPTYQASAARVERSEIRVCFKPLLGGVRHGAHRRALRFTMCLFEGEQLAVNAQRAEAAIEWTRLDCYWADGVS